MNALAAIREFWSSHTRSQSDEDCEPRTRGLLARLTPEQIERIRRRRLEHLPEADGRPDYS